MFTSPEELTEFIHQAEVDFIDVRFCDLAGMQQHFTVPAATFLNAQIDQGVMFDGSSMPGFTRIHESDMKLIPDLSSAYLDPFRKAKTLVLIFSIVDPLSDTPFSRDPRFVAQKAEQYLRESSIADTCFIGAEAEFHLFDSVRYAITPQHSYYKLDARAAHWNAGKNQKPGNLGHKLQPKGGYFPVPPMDQFADVRDQISLTLADVGLELERAHHEVGAAGQQEVNYRFAELVHAADDMEKFKYVVKNVAAQNQLSATFMPKPVIGDNGSGMHVHISLWKDGDPLFFDPNGYSDLSQTALWFIGGLLKHAPALLAFTNPTTNSYRRLVPGFEAPTAAVYSARNRSAAIRIPLTGSSAVAKRVEFRVPDPSANPYLAFSACLMAGLDGIHNQIDPGAPVDRDLYDMNSKELLMIPQLPSSLGAALKALDADREFLLQGGVFTEDLIDTWIEMKRQRDIAAIRTTPHPLEFDLYYGV